MQSTPNQISCRHHRKKTAYKQRSMKNNKSQFIEQRAVANKQTNEQKCIKDNLIN